MRLCCDPIGMMNDSAEKPEDPDEMIKQYFEQVAERHQIVEADAGGAGLDPTRPR